MHAFGTAVEGWLVLVLRRHVTAVADLTDDEAAELGFLIRDVSRALQRVLDCPKTYVAQFAEHPQHPHVHVHVIPRAGDLPRDRQGPRIFTELGADDHLVTEARMNDIAERVRQELPTRN